jgi:hypothetical protein
MSVVVWGGLIFTLAMALIVVLIRASRSGRL